jgi:urease accessory protein
MVSDWLMWQLADSAFPTGGFAHSAGLEAAWHHGLVVDGPSVADFIRAGLRQCTHGALVFLRATWRDSQRFVETDQQCDLFLNNHVANRASRAQGRAFLTAATRIFPDTSAALLLKHVRDEKAAAHLAPVFGAVACSLGLDESQTTNLFLFMFVRSCLSSAVRLGIIGPLEAQKIQSQLPLQEESVANTSAEIPVQTTPLLDLVQATQDRLYSKLFQS